MMENKKVSSKVSPNQQVFKPSHHGGGINLLGDQYFTE